MNHLTGPFALLDLKGHDVRVGAECVAVVAASGQ